MDTTINGIVTDTQENKFTERVVVPVERIASCRTLGDAYKLCYAMSGRDLKQVAADCGMSIGLLSRILGSGSVDDRRWMPHDKVLPFMVACGNSIPLQWLQLQWQALSRPVQGAKARTADVLGLHDRLDDIEANIHLILSEMRKPGDDDSLSVCVDRVEPVWLVMRLVDLEMMLHGGAE